MKKKNTQVALQKIPPKSIPQKTELNISLAKNGISETIENNSEISEEEAMEILELMKNSQEDFIQPDNEETEENTIKCSAACNKRLKEDNYIDHILECETQIEECWRCGEEYKNNDVHRSLEKHSTPEQRFACMTCMRAHATRIRIVGNHKNICLGSGIRKDLVNGKTPEVTGEEMQQAYDSDKLIKKLLKEDFRKRNRKHRKSLKNNTNPIKIIITTLGLISLIYAATFIIMKSAEKTEIRKLTLQSAKNTEPNNLKTKEYEPDLEKINEENWKKKM